MPIFAPAITEGPRSRGILLRFKISKGLDGFIGPGLLANVNCPDSFEGIFNAFRYCADTGLSAALGCSVDLAPETKIEVEARRLKIQGDSLSLAVALTLIAFVEGRRLKSAISATGALRHRGQSWGCEVVANIEDKISLARTNEIDLMIVPAGSHPTKRHSPSQITKIVTLPAVIPGATKLLMQLALAH